MFYREGLLAPRPTPKLEDHPSSAVRDCLFDLFAATLLIGGRSCIRNLRTRHAVVTGTHYMALQLTNKIKERTLNRDRVSVSASLSRSWTFQGTSHVNYLVIKSYKLAEQTGSYTPNPTREEYGSMWFTQIINVHCVRTCSVSLLQIRWYCS